jgi:hypothetical protein
MKNIFQAHSFQIFIYSSGPIIQPSRNRKVVGLIKMSASAEMVEGEEWRNISKI